MSRRGVRISAVVIFAVAALAGRANAWGPDGHKTVATIADKLIAGTKAADQVHAILGTTSLEDAAVWADCAKGVQASNANPPVFTYKGAGTYPECAPFETPEGEAEMIDFVKRNYDNCKPKAGEEICHKQYHYSDISIDHDKYASTFVGARPDDVESAISAMIAVLQGQAAPAPFSIKSQREALLLLVHYAGDVHQPLHVGAIYLDALGHRVNPDVTHYDPATDTRGGNNIELGANKNLHATWDAIPAEMTASHVDTPWLAAANKVAKAPGAIGTWSAAWASATQKQAQKALKNLKLGSRWEDTRGTVHWSTTLPGSYDGTMATIKKTQLTAGGAHLAQLLKALWP
jgi:hypothetical protein